MKPSIFDELKQSMKEAVQIARGESAPSRTFTAAAPDVKAIRERTGLSQMEFARLLRVNVKTLQNWEQHRRTPTGAAAALLTVFEREPEAALRALHRRAA
ncbi:NadS family protein [Geoalkalibacter sp.]|uniref:NadS family protein n=1 Tax=Geoalkalibacter sp. TaxID=3041440 RepID=UPI00272ED2E8|nr:NadS family protein [Geoalkalibacter sp.]